MSIDYYDRNAATFIAGSVDADMSDTRARFLAHVKPRGTILDGGCGSGRDALAFKQAGYDVTAFDGSAALAGLASAHTGLAVRHMLFSQVEWRDAFDGIWTCASLLHVPRAELNNAMQRLARALRPGGAWFVSFKYGATERVADDGRYFNDMTEELLATAIAGTGLRISEMWTSRDVRPERAGNTWLGALATRDA